MISIVGLGNAASKIVHNFEQYKQYNVFYLNNKLTRSSKRKHKLKEYENPEDYEEKIPNLKKFFNDLDDHVQFVVVGSAASTNFALGILEQIQKKKIDLIYIKPDIELLTGIPKLVENTAFGVLQEYARSGKFNSITIISNPHIEEALGDLPIRGYFEALNSSTAWVLHYMNYFANSEPEIGQVANPAAPHRIRSVAMLDMENLEEKWLFELDTPRDLCYFMCINDKRLETEKGLHKKIVNQLKDKPRNAFRKISYAIYGTNQENDFGFCVAHTNVVQKNT